MASHEVLREINFSSLEDLVLNLIVDEKDFCELTTNRERIAFLFNNLQAMDTIKSFVDRMTSHRLGKSEEKTVKMLGEGNVLMKEDRIEDALNKYNEAILWAPQELDSKSLFLIFSKRSEAFFRLDRFKEALLDIDEALKLNVPIKGNHSLLVRKLKCLDEDEAREDSDFHHNFPQMALIDENETLFGANKRIEMGYNATKGRIIEATRDIAEGQVLVIEKPFVTLLDPFFYSEFCHHCLMPLKSGRFVSCPNCPLVSFCSNNCLEEACRLYHSIECTHLMGILSLPVGHLAFRCALVSGVDEAMKVKKEGQISYNEWPKKEFGHDFRSLSSFASTSKGTTFKGLLRYSVIAVILSLFAERLSLLSEEGDKLIFAEIMLEMTFRQIILLKYNEEIKGTKFRGVYVELEADSDSFHFLGDTVTPTCSLFSHSCSPNATRLLVGSKRVVIASRPIKRGEEVCVSYKPLATSSVRRRRQEWLKTNFDFDCLCEACSSDDHCWPQLRCPSCDGNLVPNILCEDQKMPSNDCIGCGKINQNISRLLERKLLMDNYIIKATALMDRNVFGEETKQYIAEARSLAFSVYQTSSPESVRLKVAFSRFYCNQADTHLDLVLKCEQQVLTLKTTFAPELHFYHGLEQLVNMNALLTLSKNNASDSRLKETKQLFNKMYGKEFSLLPIESLKVYAKACRVFPVKE